jgi:hypothetical protein
MHSSELLTTVVEPPVFAHNFWVSFGSSIKEKFASGGIGGSCRLNSCCLLVVSMDWFSRLFTGKLKPENIGKPHDLHGKIDGFR